MAFRTKNGKHYPLNSPGGMNERTFNQLRSSDSYPKPIDKENISKDMQEYVDANIHLSGPQLEHASKRWGSKTIMQRQQILRNLNLKRDMASQPLGEFPHYAKMLVADMVLGL